MHSKAQYVPLIAVDWLDAWFDWSKWVAIYSLSPFAVPVSVVWMRLEKTKKLILDIEMLLQGHILCMGGAALTVKLF